MNLEFIKLLAATCTFLFVLFLLIDYLISLIIDFLDQFNKSNK